MNENVDLDCERSQLWYEELLGKKWRCDDVENLDNRLNTVALCIGMYVHCPCYCSANSSKHYSLHKYKRVTKRILIRSKSKCTHQEYETLSTSKIFAVV